MSERRPICVTTSNPERYLSTLGEASSRWARTLGSMLFVMNQIRQPSLFLVTVPHVARQEWRCNAGKCSGVDDIQHIAPSLIVSLATLFPHIPPRRIQPGFKHRVVWASNTTDATECDSTLSRRTTDISTKDGGTLTVQWSPFVCLQAARAVQCPLDTEWQRAAFSVLAPKHTCSETTEAPSCAHLFLRRPIFWDRQGVHAMMSNLYHGCFWPGTKVRNASCNGPEGKADWNVYSPVPIEAIARVARNVAARNNVSCMELNFDAGRSRLNPRVVDTMLENISNAKVRIYHVPRTPGAVSNAEAMVRAAQASVLITELGTQWTDVPLAMRCIHGGASFILGRDHHGSVKHVQVSCNPPWVGSPNFGRGQNGATDFSVFNQQRH